MTEQTTFKAPTDEEIEALLDSLDELFPIAGSTSQFVSTPNGFCICQTTSGC